MYDRLTKFIVEREVCDTLKPPVRTREVAQVPRDGRSLNFVTRSHAVENDIIMPKMGRYPDLRMVSLQTNRLTTGDVMEGRYDSIISIKLYQLAGST